MTDISEPPTEDDTDYFLPDPTDRPVQLAAKVIAKCHGPTGDPDGTKTMLMELRAAMAEFSPGGHFRTPDTRLSAQSAVLDALFYRSAEEAIHVHTNREGQTNIRLAEHHVHLALKIQDQYRRTMEGLKTDVHRREKLGLDRARFVKSAKNRDERTKGTP